MIVQTSCTNDVVKLVFGLSTHWTVYLDMSTFAERVSKAHWQQYAWAALKKVLTVQMVRTREAPYPLTNSMLQVGDYRTVEEAKSVILDPNRTRVKALWRGLGFTEKCQLVDVIRHLGNGALYWDDDPETCLQLFTLHKLMLEVLSADCNASNSLRMSVNGALSLAGLRVYCEFWRKSVSLDSLNQLSFILNNHSDEIDWHSTVQFFDVMGIGCRVAGKSEVALHWHRHALRIVNLQANEEQPVLEAGIRSNLARALFLMTLQDEAFDEACRAKQIIEDYAGKRGTHLREETIYHVNTTYLMINLIKGRLHHNGIPELSRAAMAEMEGIYGQDAKLVKKYQRELDDMIKSPQSFALVP